MLVLAVASGAVLGGCTVLSKPGDAGPLGAVEKIRPGMDKDAVFLLLGEPEYTREMPSGDWWGFTTARLAAAAPRGRAAGPDERTISITFDGRKRVRQCVVTAERPEAVKARGGVSGTSATRACAEINRK